MEGIRLGNPQAPGQGEKNEKRASRLRSAVTGLILVICAVIIFQVTQSGSRILDSYVKAIDAHDWERLVVLTAEDQKEQVSEFYSDPDNQQEQRDFFNVVSAKLSLVNEMDSADAEKWIDLSPYPHRTYGKDLNVYILGINLEVHEESPALYDGLNLFLAVTVKEEQGFSVANLTPMPPALIESEFSKALDDGNENVEKALEMALLRSSH